MIEEVQSAPKKIDGLTEGRIVRYVLPDGPNRGQSRAAMVVRVWDASTGCSNLMVFADGTNDGAAYANPLHVGSVIYSEGHEPGSWHWTPKA